MSINTWYQCIDPERLERLIDETRDDPTAPPNYIFPEELDEEDDYELPEPHLWTERNWYALHIILTSGEWAKQPLLGDSIAGGTHFGYPYGYYEPVRYLRADKVRAIAAALQTVSEEALHRSCNPALLEDWRDEYFPDLWKTFSDIRDFFQMAQSRNYALLVYLS